MNTCVWKDCDETKQLSKLTIFADNYAEIGENEWCPKHLDIGRCVNHPDYRQAIAGTMPVRQVMQNIQNPSSGALTREQFSLAEKMAAELREKAYAQGTNDALRTAQERNNPSRLQRVETYGEEDISLAKPILAGAQALKNAFDGNEGSLGLFKNFMKNPSPPQPVQLAPKKNPKKWWWIGGLIVLGLLILLAFGTVNGYY